MTSPLKEKQQHFLNNEEILNKEIEVAELSSKDKVIEIGAGNGVLTRELIKRAGKVLSFETDKRFKEELGKIKDKNLELIYDDALKYSWKGYNKIVSNIPYSLSEQVTVKAANEGIRELVLIVGEKFKTKLMDETKIGIFARLFYEIEPILFVGKENFYPHPRVDSWIIKLNWKEKVFEKEELMRKILTKEGKTKNAIMYSLVEYGKTKNQAREIIAKMNLSQQVLEKTIKKSTAKFLIILRKELERVE
jgi:16S rRNA (adenine1518-N6/adenine1519-N6)-dimethyltransferase